MEESQWHLIYNFSNGPNQFWLIVDHLTFDFSVLKEKKLFNKTRWGVNIICMEEAFVPCEYKMEVTSHHDPILYGKSILAFKLLFLIFFVSIYIILLLDLFIYFPFLHF